MGIFFQLEDFTLKTVLAQQKTDKMVERTPQPVSASLIP